MDRQDKLDWGGETSTEVPLSKALNTSPPPYIHTHTRTHLVQWGHLHVVNVVVLGKLLGVVWSRLLLETGNCVHLPWLILFFFFKSDRDMN